MGSDEKGAEVIPLRPGLDELDRDAELISREKEPNYCRHRRLELDTDARRVYCRDCGDEVPAFDALDSFRRVYQGYTQRIRQAQAEAQALEARIEELKRRERNAKARVKRAEGKA